MTKMVFIAVVVAGSAGAPFQGAQDCLPREADAITAHEQAASQAPQAFLAQVELATCYDNAWRFQDVEPAIAKAIVILEVESSGASRAPASAGARPIAGDGVPAPKRTRYKQAAYPDGALISGVSGFVVLEIVIGAKGDVREVRVAKSVPGLDKAAINAAKKWKYEPTLVGGKAIEVLIYAFVRFSQTTERLPSDWLEISAFYYRLGLQNLARAALNTALGRAREDRDRFGTYVDSRIASAPGGLPGVTLPVLTKKVEPRYSRRALVGHAEGSVRLEALVDTSGNVGRARIITKPSFLDVSSIDALRQWKFKPALKDGSPVAVLVVAEMEFRLH